MELIIRKRKDKKGKQHELLALTRKDYFLRDMIGNQKHLVKSGEQETYDVSLFEAQINVLIEIAKLCSAITTPPSQHKINLATEIGKEVSRISGIDFLTCFEATKIRRRHISQKLRSYDDIFFNPKLKPTQLKILLVDDIIFTGRTLAETKRILEELGNFVIPVALTYT